MTNNNKVLETVYHDPLTGYTGINDLVRKTKIKPSVVKSYLETQDVYTKHYPKIEKFKRRRFYTPGIDEIWQCDLVFMPSEWSNENNGYRYINLIIDTLSKYLWSVPLKTKNAEEVVESFNNILVNRIPTKINSDKGTEYISSKTKSLFKKHNIQWYTTENETKAMIVERVARTIQQRMYKYMTDNNTTKWYDVLDKLVENYNNSYHTSIKMTPCEASKYSNELIVYDNLYGKQSRLGKLENNNTVSEEFSVGDMVRTHKFGTKFDRGYKPTYADEILFIKKVLKTDPPVYKIEDYHGNEISGTYYQNELVKYDKQEEDYEFEYIIKTKKTDNPDIVKAFVKWKGYSDRFNSWVNLTPEQIKSSTFLPKTNQKYKQTLQTRTKRHVAKGR
jgi:transposase InsO family protein